MPPKPHLFCLTLLCLLAAASPALAAPALIHSVVVEGSTVHLGDVFSDAGAKAGLVIAAAPAPGQHVVYDANVLLQLARSNSLDWKPSSNYEQASISRASQSITPEMIKALVVAELGKTDAPRQLDVALDNKNLTITRAKEETLDYRLVDLHYDPIQCSFKATLVVANGQPGEKAEVFPLSGRAMPLVMVAILTHPVEAGSMLGADDVQWSQVAADKAGADAITNPARFTHMEASHNLGAQSVLRLHDLRNARLVTKGSMVQMTMQTDTMSLSTLGRALQDGALGETVPVLNPQSNRTVDAVVTGTGSVAVHPLLADQPLKIAAQHP